MARVDEEPVARDATRSALAGAVGQKKKAVVSMCSLSGISEMCETDIRNRTHLGSG